MRPPIWVEVRAPGVSYGGRAYQAGELALLAPFEAVLAHRRGEISMTRPAAAAIAAASVRMAERAADDAPPPEPAPAKRRYRRRDLEPEQ